MRTMISGINLAQHLGKELKVIWKTELDFNCQYHKLFGPNKYFDIHEAKIKNIYSSFNRSSLKRNSLKLINRINGFDLVICEQDLHHTFFNHDFKVASLSKYKKIYIRNCEQFFGGNQWNSFEPISEIQEKIETITASFPKNSVGIHIRRTDNGKSIQFSPLSKFIELMQKEIELDNNILFFLATDDLNTQNSLAKLFSNRNLIFYEKEFSRSEQRGIQDACVDLFCLSNCQRIFGSYWSSFTEVASYIHGANISIIKEPHF